MTDETYPLISIVTPTFPGRESEIVRCMSSVLALDWPGPIQHVVISDRRTERRGWIETCWEDCEGFWAEGVMGVLPDREMTYVEINESWRNATTEASIGAIPWYVGSLLAMGEFIGFCGDDDEMLPGHVRRHVTAMREQAAMFSVSPIQFRAHGVDQFIIGDAFAHGQLDATGIMCHKDALTFANWTANGENAADWRLVRDWIAAGLVGTLIGGEPTGVHNDGWLIGKTGRPDLKR